MHIQLRVQPPLADSFAWSFQGSKLTIGRDPQCELRFNDAGAPSVSWQHAQIDLQGRVALLSDLNSSNGTFWNEKRISGRQPIGIGDRITLGKAGPTIEVMALAASEPDTHSKDRGQQKPGTDGGDRTLAGRPSPRAASSAEGFGTASRGDRGQTGGVGFPPRDGLDRAPGIAVAGEKSAYVPFVAPRADPIRLPAPVADPPKGMGSGSGIIPNEKRSQAGSETRRLVLNVVARQKRASRLVAAVGVTLSLALLAIFFFPRDSPPAPPQTDGDTRYRNVLRGTLLIRVQHSSSATAIGTGFLVDDSRRLAITNAHIVGDATEALVWFPEFDSEGEVIRERGHYQPGHALRAEVLLKDPLKDLAILRLSTLPSTAVALPLADKHPGAGTQVHMIGNPGEYEEALWITGTGTVNAIVTAWEGRFEDGSLIQAEMLITDISTIQPGASGGPVVDEQGRVVGINQGGHVVELGGQRIPLAKKFCVSVDEIHRVLAKVP